jgi:hypothetical protein
VKRRLLTLFSALSLLMFVSVCCAGVRSHWQGTLVGWKGTRWTVFIRSHYGQMWVYVQATDAGESLGWSAESWPLTRAPNPSVRPQGWGESGFAYAVGGSAGGNVARQFAVPYWAFALLCAMLPGAWLILNRRRRRLARAGLCLVCGYDLRATPERCPECGAEPAASVASGKS